MMCSKRFRAVAFPTLAAAMLLGGGFVVLPSTMAAKAETAVAPEKNPPGDIPDDQVFVVYRGQQGYALKVPEGWGRTDAPAGADFADKYGRIAITVTAAGPAPTVQSVKDGEAAELSKTGHAVKIASIDAVKLPAGPTVKIVFTSNSEPNPVTDKRIRLENELFVIGGPGKTAKLTLSAPAGADNADQWKLIVDSFRWS